MSTFKKPTLAEWEAAGYPLAAGDIEDIQPLELAAMLQAAEGDGPLVLDVREPWEYATAQLPGATLIPLGDIAHRAEEVPKETDVVVYCHHGMRSARAVSMLRLAGWNRVFNLSGGIDRWSVEVDAAVPRY